MIGKRVIILKRPAVLCAAAFVLGIVSAQYSGWLALCISAGLFVCCVLFLHSLRNGRRRISVADKLLLLASLFLLFGYGVMSRQQDSYKYDTETFAECMEDGREILVKGTVSHIRRTESGARLELKDAVVTAYEGEDTAYRPVGRLLIYTEDLSAENGELKHGQYIFVYGSGSTFDKASNPGNFDAKAYYFSLGITGAVHGKTVRIIDFSYQRLNQALFQAKNKLLNSYVTYLGQEGAGVISSMLLGERSLLPDETRELYRHGGISHILAISGLHVSLIGMALYEFLRKTVLGRNGAIPAACAGVMLYGTFVEAGTSTKRAVIMFLLLLLATALGRTYDTLSAMSVSVIVILCESPGALYTASFQLSFAAAYGASVLAAVLRGKREGSGEMTAQIAGLAESRSAGEHAIEAAKRVAKRNNRRWYRGWEYIMEKVRNMFVFGLAIQAVTFPFTVYHFFEYPTYGFFLNPLVVPLMTILLLCGLLSGICGMFVPWLGYFFAGGTGGILWIYESLCRWTEQMPGSLLLFGRPQVWQVCVYFVILGGSLYMWQGRGRKKIRREFGTEASNRKKSIGRCVGGAVRNLSDRVVMCLEKQHMLLGVVLLLPFILLPLPGTRFEAAFLDVDQGDGIVLRERNGAVLLVDGGSTGVQNVGEKRMIPYLKAQGIRVIDCVLISHTDSDHMNGIKEILEAMPACSAYRESVAGYTGTPVIKCIVLPEWYSLGEKIIGDTNEETVENVLLGEVDEAYLELLKLAEEKQVEVCYMKAGDRMTVGKELVLSCLAPKTDVIYDNKNAASMVLLVSYGEFDLLLTGDMEKEGERRLSENHLWNRKDGGSGILTVEVLKVAHHGSYTASSKEFITALAPQIAVISCGKDNRYGHPHAETLATLYEANSRVYRTDESGCVTVRVGKKIAVDEFRK